MVAVPQIHRKQQWGVPVNINKSRALAVIVSDFVAFDDPRRGEVQQTARGVATADGRLRKWAIYV
jgi:hypothetical protein